MACSHCVVYCVACNLYVGFAQSSDSRFVIQTTPYLSSAWILCKNLLFIALLSCIAAPYVVAYVGRYVQNRKGYGRNCRPLKDDCCKNVWPSVVRFWSRLVWILFLRLWCRVQLSCVATISYECASIVSRRGDVCPEDGGSRYLGTCVSNYSVSYRNIEMYDVTVCCGLNCLNSA
jgi:hypothetical protein